MSKRSMMQEVKSMVDSKRILDALLRHLTSNKAIDEENLDTVLGLTIRKIADTLFAQNINVYTVDSAQAKIRHRKVHFTPYLYGGDDEKKNYFEKKAAHMETLQLPLNGGVAGFVMRTRRTAHVVDVRSDPHFYNHIEEDSIFIPRSMIAVPMIANNNVIGCIQAFNRCPDYEEVTQFGEDDVMLMEDVAHYTSLIIQKSLDPTTVFSERELAGYVARLAKVHYVEIDANFRPDIELIKWMGEETLLKYGILPVEMRSENTCSATMANPNDFQSISDFEIVTGFKIVEKSVSSYKDIVDFMTRTFPKATQIDKAKEAIEKEFGEIPTTESRELKMSELDYENENAGPIVKLSSQIIEDAYTKGASDIHIEALDGKVRVRYRIDGILKEMMEIPTAAHRALISRFKIMSDLNISERRLPQDGRIIYRKFNSKFDLDLRVSSLPSNHGEKICARILDKTKSTLPLDRLGFSNYNLKVYRDIIQAPYGLILHSGPTGSGKSMSLYSALNEINSPQWNIVTIEDPIEYTLSGLNQVQVKKDIGLTFATALRSFLRQDPDIILVGEIRDLETAEIAIEAALTGHLLFSTLHTNDAPSAVARFDEMGIEPFMISTCLLCVCAQRLVRRVCSCRAMDVPTADEYDLLDRALDFAPIGKIPRARGCAKCENTGFKGRMGVHEIMKVNDEIRGLINHRSSLENLKQAAREGGMRTLFEDLMEKVKAGHTTLPEAIGTARPDDTPSPQPAEAMPVTESSADVMTPMAAE
ncbi:MAG: GspE/PulE family protein [Planctomycetota bacterium]